MKNVKKYKNVCILLVLVVILSTGCSGMIPMGNKSESFADNNYGGGNYYDYAYESSAADYGYEYEAEMLYELTAGDVSYSMLSGEDGGSTTSNLPADRKIIRDANITMEVEDVEKSYDNILSLLSGFGGYEARREMQSDSNRYYDSRGYSKTPTVGATLKIPAEKLDAFLAELKKEGETIFSNISSNDISDQYYDSKIRITTLEKTLENYYGFLENAQDVDEQLRVTRYINDITQEIEQLKGSIKRWDSLVDYSTITLNLYRPYEAPVPEPEPREINWNSLSFEDMGWFISSGFLSVCNAIVSAIQWIIIAIIIISPIVIPIIIILFVLLHRHKKNQKKKMQVQENIPENNK